MKIITDKAAYVQMNDIMMLNRSGANIPSSVFMKVFGNGVLIIDESNRYDFVEFNNKNEIEFFNNLDWIINYLDVKDYTEEEIIELGIKINDDKNVIAKKYNDMSKKERAEHVDLVEQHELLDFKFNSLREILWFQQGHIKMELPNIDEIPKKQEQDKGIKKLVKSLFPKK